MNDYPNHRVITKTQALMVLLSVIVVGGLVLLATQIWLESRLALIAALPVDESRTALVQIIRYLALGNIVFITALSFYVMVYGRRGLRTELMPPQGSWIVAGRPVFQGADAVRRARIVILLGLLVLVLGCGSTFYMLQVAKSFEAPLNELPAAQPLANVLK